MSATEYGIFTDESANYTADEALEAGFTSREAAEQRLAKDYAEDGAWVHAVEEAEDDE